MKKILLGTSLLLAVNLFAYDNYMKTAILYTVPSDLKTGSQTFEMKSGYALEIAIGQKFSKEFTFEAQYSYDQANVKGINSNIKVHSLYLNAIYNLNIASRSMHPYLGLGLGGAAYTDGTTNDEVFTYQGFLGCSFDTDYNMETFVEYKYKDYVDVQLDGVSYDDTNIHSLGIGLKSKF
jgi:outer membrane protein W